MMAGGDDGAGSRAVRGAQAGAQVVRILHFVEKNQQQNIGIGADEIVKCVLGKPGDAFPGDRRGDWRGRNVGCLGDAGWMRFLAMAGQR